MMENFINRDDKYKLKSTLSYIDPFLGIYNRLFLSEFIPQILKDTIEKKQKLSVFMIDLDNFKYVNDSYGHIVGDKVIESIAEIFKKIVRETDYLIRYAGDEFLFILSPSTLESSYKVAERLLEGVRNFKFSINDKIIIQTVSIGFALFPDDASNLEELIKYTDEALYFAKKKGRNCAVYFKEVNINKISIKIALDRIPCPLFIDREKEIDIIKRKIDEFKKSGNARSIIISGPSGIGKSRFLKEIRNSLDGPILYYNASLNNHLVSFYLISSLLDLYFRNKLFYKKDDLDFILKNINDEYIDILCNFIPTFKEIFPNKRKVTFEKNILFEIYFNLIKNILEIEKKIFFMIDNVHYSDLASLEFIDFLFSKAANLNIFLFLVTLDPLPADTYNIERFKKIIEKFVLNSDTISIRLNPFSYRETEEMINAIFPQIENLKYISDLVFETTKGNQFFIEEFLKYLIEISLIYFEDNRWKVKDINKESLPKSVEDIIKQRFKILDPDIKEVIFISSVIGENITPSVLSKVKLTKEGEVLELLEKASRLKIMKEEMNGFNFLNEIVKDTAFKEIPIFERRNISTKVYEVLLDFYKENIETIAFQLGNIFYKTEDLEKLEKLYRIINQKISEIYNPQEILKYLEGWINAFEESDRFQEIIEVKPEDGFLITELFRLFQGILRDYNIYPKNSIILRELINNLYELICKLLKNYNKIEISEDSGFLIINRKRITKMILKTLDINYLLKFLIEREVKSFSFRAGILKEELESFFSIITLEPFEFNNINLKEVFLEKSIRHISIKKIDLTAKFLEITPFEKKLEGNIFLDFLLGKISGKDLVNFNLLSLLKEDPKTLSKEFVEAVEFIKNIEKYKDKFDIFSEGLQKFFESLTKTTDTQIENLWKTKEMEKKLVDLFFNFDTDYRAQLIKKSYTKDKLVETILRSLNEKDISKFLDELFTSQMSLYGLKDIITKLNNIYKESDKNFEALFSCKINNLSQEQIKFIKGEIRLIDLPFKERLSEIFKLDIQDLKNIPKEELSSIIEELILSQDYQKFKDFFIYIRRICLEKFEVASKIKTIYIDVFKKIYFSGKQRIIYDVLNSLISIAKISISKEDFIFILDVIYGFIENTNFYGFKRSEELDKINILYNIYSTIKSNKKLDIEEDELKILEKKFNFNVLITELFNFYIDSTIIEGELKSVKESMFNFFIDFSDEVIENLVKKFKNLYDPFDKFLIIKKIIPFLNSLSIEDLKKVINSALKLFDLDDLCNILSYIDAKNLNIILGDVYLNSEDKNREKILELVRRINLTDAEGFLKKLLKDETHSNLKDIIIKVIDKIKKGK